jgi:hypothetical protein
MALRYECKSCGAMRGDVLPCPVCGARELRPVRVRLTPGRAENRPPPRRSEDPAR